MNNPRMTVKERNLVKGALRRVFSRSDLRIAVIKTSLFPEYKNEDPKRNRVKTWCLCPLCETPTAKSYMIVDHIVPIIKLNETLEDLSWDTVIDRIWCEERNLMPLCVECHKSKTKAENKERRRIKKEKKNGTDNK